MGKQLKDCLPVNVLQALVLNTLQNVDVVVVHGPEALVSSVHVNRAFIKTSQRLCCEVVLFEFTQPLLVHNYGVVGLLVVVGERLQPPETLPLEGAEGRVDLQVLVLQELIERVQCLLLFRVQVHVREDAAEKDVWSRAPNEDFLIGRAK